jgi:hypothetical protein
VEFHLQISGPLPKGGRSDLTSIDADITSLRWSSSWPGGFNGAVIGYARVVENKYFASLAAPQDIKGFGDIKILAGSHTVFEGRVMLRDRDPSGLVKSCTASGYGLSATKDNWYYNKDAELVTTGVLLRSVVSTAAPLLRIGTSSQFVDTGVYYAWAEANGKQPAQFLDQICKAGDSAGNPVDYGVWEKRTLWLRSRVPPKNATTKKWAPKYRIPHDDTVDLQENFEETVGTVSVQYTPPGGTGDATSTATDSTFKARYGGLMRGLLIPNSVQNSTAAANLRDTYLARHKEPIVSARVTRSGGRGLELATGGEAAPWLVRAGEYVQIGNERPLVITSADFDANSEDGFGTLTLQLET